jgi:hypothetical protein
VVFRPEMALLSILITILKSQSANEAKIRELCLIFAMHSVNMRTSMNRDLLHKLALVR